MQIPYKPTFLPKAIKKFRYIIIHDFTCQFGSLDKARVDQKTKVTTQGTRVYNWLFKNEFELPYHFICEQLQGDYETILARPFCYFCEYDDIPEQYLPSIHIAIAGNYNFINIKQRAYQQLAYRSISSILRWFQFGSPQVLLHREISTNKDLKCPGDGFKKDKMLSAIKQYSLMKK